MKQITNPTHKQIFPSQSCIASYSLNKTTLIPTQTLITANGGLYYHASDNSTKNRTETPRTSGHHTQWRTRGRQQSSCPEAINPSVCPSVGRLQIIQLVSKLQGRVTVQGLADKERQLVCVLARRRNTDRALQQQHNDTLDWFHCTVNYCSNSAQEHWQIHTYKFI